jgi:hypothetical protein
MNDNINCSLAEGFSLWEKIYAQISFFTMGVIGTVGILLADWPWILPYIVIIWYGVPGIIMRHLVCPKCPHLQTDPLPNHGDIKARFEIIKAINGKLLIFKRNIYAPKLPWYEKLLTDKGGLT